MSVFHLFAQNIFFLPVSIDQMVKKCDLKCKQVKGQSSNEERGQNIQCSDLICFCHSTSLLQAFGKLKKINLMNMPNIGLNQNFVYF